MAKQFAMFLLCSLKTGGRDAMGSHHRTRTRSLLVITEIAFSLVLLTGAGLMIGTFKTSWESVSAFIPRTWSRSACPFLKLAIPSHRPSPFTTSCKTVCEVCPEWRQSQS